MFDSFPPGRAPYFRGEIRHILRSNGLHVERDRCDAVITTPLTVEQLCSQARKLATAIHQLHELMHARDAEWRALLDVHNPSRVLPDSVWKPWKWHARQAALSASTHAFVEVRTPTERAAVSIDYRSELLDLLSNGSYSGALDRDAYVEIAAIAIASIVEIDTRRTEMDPQWQPLCSVFSKEIVTALENYGCFYVSRLTKSTLAKCVERGTLTEIQFSESLRIAALEGLDLPP